MAMNCSSRSLLVTDDCAGMMLGCGCRSEEASPLSSCGVNSLWWDELELELELELEEEVEESDPVDLLPTDPFGMNLETTFTAAIASCIGDLTVMSGAGHFGNGGDDDLFTDLSYYYFNQAFLFAPEPCIGGDMGVFEGSFGSGGLSGGGGMDQFSRLPLNESCSEPTGSMEDPYSSCEATLVCRDTVDAAPVQEGNDVHDGMVFVLGYLGLRDILSIEMVCKSLRSAVRNEPFLWKCIHIDSRLGKKMSDADLLCLTRKSMGSLQCLSLEGCMKVTDQGLKAVLESNLQLTKLGIFGALRITYQGLLDNLRSFNMVANTGIKKLRIANRFTASEAQYEELLSLLRIDKGQPLHKQEPRIFHADSLLPDLQGGYVPDCFIPDLHDEYALDIEKCPLCPNYKLVYDCPSEECKTRGSVTCRGCVICINRCMQCGRCIDNEYHETFLLDNICRICQPLEDSPPAEK
ncbi:F-box protein SKIP14 [Dichanthelium oligosanthes]|uniref:F-box protein SKIP14 n=1 Tax=Dichanthelium oligosanthes TaxID=888268 RepID=A0A1E5V1B9_9POAL|nr:F-box protein SKIP14 [Dichanthelium oligosanthes]